MAKVKGIAKLNSAVSEELKGFGISKAKCSDDYSYIFEDNSVTFKLTEGTIEDQWFAEFIKERFNYDVRYPFVISLLHEVGHHKTDEDVQGGIYDWCLEEKARIDKEMETADDEKSKALEWQYFNLPDEIMATAWAVKYAKEHPKKVKKMWNKMQAALFNFYKMNGILDEVEDS